ncbi:MAG: helicase-exonuclease AddAB subunit AddA [Oscillospiraceae bacterium]|nr:helicase-exonuclease AddAB subunit AddA [Oscillospiraceae bacterium]
MAELILTPEQQAVVNDRGGALLVSAAAGSGKTKVLVDRVLQRVSEENCNVDDFLMITFTQAAAAELRGKLMAALSQRLALRPEDRHLQRQMSRVYLAQISTVHAFCGVVLRGYAHQLELPADFRVCDAQEAETLRRLAMEQLLAETYPLLEGDPELRSALDSFGAGRDEARLQALILKVYDGAQCYRDPAARLEDYRRMLDTGACADVGETVWGAYLIAEFHTFLDQNLEDLGVLLREVEQTPGMEKYLVDLLDLRSLMERLREAATWEALGTIPVQPKRLSIVKNCPAPELQARLRQSRSAIIEGLRKRKEVFDLPSGEALADLECSGQMLRGLLRLVERFAALFAAEKRRRHVLDYNDLEHETLRLLCGRGDRPTAAARELSGRYVEIMVDEYQDTNQVQDAIFRAISREGSNLFFVGDVKQSIYRFRLADPSIFLKKYRDFADYREAEPGQPRKILLSDNFRSHPEILSAANWVFYTAMTERVGGLRYGPAEALRPKRTMPHMGSPAVELHCVDLERGLSRTEVEAAYVARRIAEMLQQGEQIPEGDGLRPLRPEDIMILLRAPREKAGDYVEALRRQGIRAFCGGEDLFEAREVNFLLHLLEVIDNPHRDVSLLSVLLSPVFGFSADELALLRAAERQSDLWDMLGGSAHGTDFAEMIQGFRQRAQELGPRALLEEIDTAVSFRAIYGAMEDGAQRRARIESFLAVADAYESGGRFGLHGFLQHLDMLREKGMEAEAGGAANAVRITSIHKSKGLEYPVVVLADLCKGFNYADARDTVLSHGELGIGASIYDPEAHISYPTVARSAIADAIRKETLSEEMRVLYVAMTRAQYRMILSCCSGRMAEKLEAMAQALTEPVSGTLIESAASMGDWVLMAALRRTDAGELFRAGGYPAQRQAPEHPWKIVYHMAEAETEAVQQEAPCVAEEAPLLTPLFDRPYAHGPATRMPSKVTATQMKGRELDEEAAEGTLRPRLYFPRPRFAQGRAPLSPAQRGTAIHLAMQHLRYEHCGTEAGLTAELRRLGQKHFLTEQQLEAVPAGKLLRFFRSDLGRRLLDPGTEVVREFKFSLLEDGAAYDPALAGEQVLLQGVTDCCILEADGLTILDFKSDAIGPGEEARRAEYYRGQLAAYSRALARIFDRPVKERILYFFATDTAITV